jgi:pimeloyl-ACP methyl ester carboxylesterase
MPPQRPSRSRYLDIRGLRYHLREWGPPEAPAARTVWMLHGWMDVSASFQFVVDALAADWRVLAPDWRGFGLTERSGADSYWFADYLGDLDTLLDCVSPGAPVNLLGHSMGGNIAMLYAGIRPRRVRAVVNLEGFGLRATSASAAPHRYGLWLDGLKTGAKLRDYASLSDVEARLMKNNPRLTLDRAAFLAAHWAALDAHGRYVIAGDPAHRIVNPVLYRLDEMLECFKRIDCPVLWLQGEHTDVVKHIADDAIEALREIDRRRALVARVASAVVPEAGHMLHHDQPETVARLLAEFLARDVDE